MRLSMTNYNELSDFEINKRVAVAHGIDCSGINSESMMWQYNLPKDYCNNPADAWPIIVSNKMSICYHEEHEKWFADTDTDDSPMAINNNPLRAAMIVFLMMNEKDGDK